MRMHYKLLSGEKSYYKAHQVWLELSALTLCMKKAVGESGYFIHFSFFPPPEKTFLKQAGDIYVSNDGYCFLI